MLAGVLGAALLCTSLSAVGFAQTGVFSGEEDYTQYVDPFVATQVDNGQQFPGAVSPYGIVKLSPDTYPHTNDDHAGYDYAEDQIAGFSHTRVEGVGGQGAGGDVLITPTYFDRKYQGRAYNDYADRPAQIYISRSRRSISRNGPELYVSRDRHQGRSA